MGKRHRLPFFDWLYLVLAFGGFALSGFDYLRTFAASGLPSYYPYLFLGLLLLQAIMVPVEVLTKSPRKYFVAMGVHAIAVLVLVPLSAGNFHVEYAPCVVFAIGICLFNSFPVSAVLSASFVSAIVAINAYALRTRGMDAGGIVFREIELGSLVGLISLFGLFAIFYREKVIDFRDENDRLDSLVDRLTKANLRYQEYARTIEESSTENERKRITRDIHDIVGYTLTNNITMMEAITDMMHENPLGVAHLVEAARENAQQGLMRVREALYTLRKNEIAIPKGFDAVRSLVNVFERGTGVKVEIFFNDVLWQFPDEVDLSFYHVVEESLINSFRHGRATHIRVFLVRRPDEIMLKVCDNGVGADSFTEGIGISGMRERLVKIGGNLHVESSIDGFNVIAVLPLESDNKG